MKLGILALVLLIGFPLGLYFLVGKEAFNDANIVLGMMGVGAALLVMGCLFTVKNVLSFFFDFLLITFGACLLLVAAFAKPLGLFDGAEGQEIEQRIMQQDVSKKPALPSKPVELKDDQDIDKVMNQIADGSGEAAGATEGSEASVTGATQAGTSTFIEEPVVARPPLKQASMPTAKDPVLNGEEKAEGLEAFAEEAGTRIIENDADADATKDATTEPHLDDEHEE